MEGVASLRTWREWSFLLWQDQEEWEMKNVPGKNLKSPLDTEKSMSSFCSCSPHWMILIPHIHLSHVFISASQPLHAPKGWLVAPLWERFNSYHYCIYRCGLMPIHLFPSIYDVPENGQLLKHCLYTLLPRLLFFLSPQRSSVLLPSAFQYLKSLWPFLLVTQTQRIIAWSVLLDNPHSSLCIAGSAQSTIPGRNDASLKGYVLDV